jgi:hypothetical protein
MIYPIVKYGNPVLERPAAPVTHFDDELKKLVEDMFESMYAAHGVGLAAPQIGIAKRLAVIDVTFKEDPDAKLVLANPEILHTERGLPQHPRIPRALDPGAQGHGSGPGRKRQVVREDRGRSAGASLSA